MFFEVYGDFGYAVLFSIPAMLFVFVEKLADLRSYQKQVTKSKIKHSLVLIYLVVSAMALLTDSLLKNFIRFVALNSLQAYDILVLASPVILIFMHAVFFCALSSIDGKAVKPRVEKNDFCAVSLKFTLADILINIVFSMAYTTLISILLPKMNVYPSLLEQSKGVVPIVEIPLQWLIIGSTVLLLLLLLYLEKTISNWTILKVQEKKKSEQQE